MAGSVDVFFNQRLLLKVFTNVSSRITVSDTWKLNAWKLNLVLRSIRHLLRVAREVNII